VTEVGLVLLAAGASTRMGRPKQLLPIDGVPMLRRAAQAALASCCRPVVVVVGAGADEALAVIDGLDVQVVRNADWQAGMGTSIRAGIAALAERPVDAAVLALADQPRVGADAYSGLVEVHRRTECPVVASEYEATLGVPALFARRLFPELLALPAGEGCKWIILGRPAGEVARRPCPEAAVDVDTPADLERLAGR